MKNRNLLLSAGHYRRDATDGGTALRADFLSFAGGGARTPAVARCRWLFTAGISYIVFSDTLIACREFLSICGLYGILMTPTYYAAHILITAAVIIHNSFTLMKCTLFWIILCMVGLLCACCAVAAGNQSER
jgi:hypothetical protein